MNVFIGMFLSGKDIMNYNGIVYNHISLLFLYLGRNCDKTTNGRQIDPESFTLQGKETIKIHEEPGKVLGDFVNYLPKQ